MEQKDIVATETQPIILREDKGGLVPTDFDSLYRMARIMAASGMMPKDINTAEKVFVAVQLGLEIGLTPMQSVQHIAVINGRPSVWGKAALGLVMASGQLEAFDETELMGEDGSFTGYLCMARRKGRKEAVAHTFLMTDAETAGLSGKTGPWQQYPKRMCQMRARGFVLSDLFPDVLGGLFIAEESQDISPPDPTFAPPFEDSVPDKLKARLVKEMSVVEATNLSTGETHEEPVIETDEDGVVIEEEPVAGQNISLDEEKDWVFKVEKPARVGNWYRTLVKFMETLDETSKIEDFDPQPIWEGTIKEVLHEVEETDINKIPATKRVAVANLIQQKING